MSDILYKVLIEKDRYLAYLEGFKTTLLLSFFSVLLGTAIGFVIAIIKYVTDHNKSQNAFKCTCNFIGNFICNAYIAVIRGTPVYVQMLIIYFVIFSNRETSPLLSGVVCFGINSSAYVAEIIRAGIEAVDGGQSEAGRSLGLSFLQTMIYIVIPQAIKNILPALGNEFIVLIKETAIVGNIAVLDVTKAAMNIGVATYNYLPPLLLAATIYFIVVMILTKLLRGFERRLAKSDRR